MKKKAKPFVVKVMQGSLIGIGAVLPGISGGVLCVAFGIYKTIMEFLASPFRNFKTHFPKLIPVIIGGIIGFLGIANLLSFLLDKFENQSICVFVGLISGMMPSLFREAGERGRNKKSYISLILAFVLISALLISLKLLSVSITPNFLWYVFCGFCLALSVIAPGMSFSTLLMPLGLYETFIDGIGHLNFSILIPGAIGAIVTVIMFAKAINALFNRFYSVSFHAIIGIVIAATVMIIPFKSFTESVLMAVINLVCIAFGAVAALLIDKFNQKYTIED